MGISLYVLFLMLCILHGSAQQCGHWVFANFRWSLSYCHQHAGALTLGTFPTSFMMRCDGATGGLMQDGYTTSDCSGAVTTTNVTLTHPGHQCGVACGMTINGFTDDICTAVNTFGTIIGASASGVYCQTTGIMQTCDATHYINYNFGVGNTNCADTPTFVGATIRRVPFGVCNGRQIIQNCVRLNNSILPMTLTNKQTLMTSSGLTCDANAITLIEDARIGLCLNGLTTYCGGSGGTLWQFWTQDAGGVINCGPQLMFAQFLNTGACSGNIAKKRPFFPVGVNTSATHSCVGSAFPPVIDFTTDQYALVSVYRDSMCNASVVASNLLYKTYVRADGSCERATNNWSWRRICQADGSMLSLRYASASCASNQDMNFTAANGTCSSYVSGETLSNTADIFMFVEFCGAMGATSVQPDQAPGSQKFNTSAPSLAPSSSPSSGPSQSPSTTPTKSPSKNPTATPSKNPSTTPSTSSPSVSPTTSSPTATPSKMPTTTPSKNPSTTPSVSPSQNPSSSPSLNPSASPSQGPSQSPSMSPSNNPSVTPTTSAPSTTPSMSPSTGPSMSPSKNPSVTPTTGSPSMSPSGPPSMSPSSPPTTGNSRASKIGNPAFCMVLAVIVAVVASFN